MASIRPFCAVRYNSNQVNLNEVTFTQGEPLPENLSPYHLKHILEPTSSLTARSKFVKYAKSSALLNDWIRREILSIEKKPAYYIYEQRFKDYLGREKVRTNLLCLLKIEEYGKGNIYPHEQVVSSKIDDRVRLLESAGTHFEPIMGLYDDTNGLIEQTLNQADKKRVICFSDEIEHRIYEIDVPIASLFEGKEIWIADGHHRYESALKFQLSLPFRQKERPTDYIFANLVSLGDPGLCVYPLHLLYSLSEEKVWELFSSLELSPCDPKGFENLFSEKKHQNSNEAGIVFPTKGYFIVAHLKESIHKYISQLPLPIDYLYSYDELIQGVRDGGIAIFMPYLSSTHLLDCIVQKKQMRPKTTCFVPKLRSGLLFWSFLEETGF